MSNSPQSQFRDLHERFLQILREDPDPMAPTALFWHEVSPYDDPDTRGPLVTRGPNGLTYYRSCKKLEPLRAQFSWEESTWPERVCRQVLSQGTGEDDDIFAVSYRYEQTKGLWEGGYLAESFAQRAAVTSDRAPVEADLLQWFRDRWTAQTKSAGLLYGLQNWDEPGPRTRLNNETGNNFYPTPPELAEIHSRLIGAVQAHGFPRVHTYSYSIRKHEDCEPDFSRISFGYGI